jgi:hypothetical protein
VTTPPLPSQGVNYTPPGSNPPLPASTVGQPSPQPTGQSPLPKYNPYILYRRTLQRVDRVNVPVPPGVPRFLGNRQIILVAWLGAMAMVSWDEWNTYHILPRPARLWYTSLTYFLLAIIATFDVFVPIANGLAIGFAIAVAYQYFTNTGQFAPSPSRQPATPSTNPPTTTPSTTPTTGTGANPGTPPSHIVTGTGQAPGTTTAGGRGSNP